MPWVPFPTRRRHRRHLCVISPCHRSPFSDFSWDRSGGQRNRRRARVAYGGCAPDAAEGASRHRCLCPAAALAGGTCAVHLCTPRQVAWDSVHMRRAPGGAPGFAGLANYDAILADAAFRKAVVNNLIYAAGTIVPTLVIALGFALALAHSGRVNNLLRAAFFMPVLIPL